jgi:hypothetical protein
LVFNPEQVGGNSSDAEARRHGEKQGKRGIKMNLDAAGRGMRHERRVAKEL